MNSLAILFLFLKTTHNCLLGPFSTTSDYRHVFWFTNTEIQYSPCVYLLFEIGVSRALLTRGEGALWKCQLVAKIFHTNKRKKTLTYLYILLSFQQERKKKKSKGKRINDSLVLPNKWSKIPTKWNGWVFLTMATSTICGDVTSALSLRPCFGTPIKLKELQWLNSLWNRDSQDIASRLILIWTKHTLRNITQVSRLEPEFSQWAILGQGDDKTTTSILILDPH